MPSISYWLAYFGFGIVAGIIAGLLGVGGGIVIVPALYWIFTLQGLPQATLMHLAIGTSLATIVFTSFSSFRAHVRGQAAREKPRGRLEGHGRVSFSRQGGVGRASSHTAAAGMPCLFSLGPLPTCVGGNASGGQRAPPFGIPI